MKKKYLLVFSFCLMLSCETFDDTLNIYTDNVSTVAVGGSATIIGGGVGYSNLITAMQAQSCVSTISELTNAIQNADEGDIIYIDDLAHLDFSNENSRIVIDKSITLASGRGSTASSGAILFSTNLNTYPLIEVRANNVRISGLKIFGPDSEVGEYDSSKPISIGIKIDGYDNLTIDNCELKGWSLGATDFKNSVNGVVKNSHIHHNRYDGLGYGVLLEMTASVLVEYNLFQYNRHDIAGEGWASGIYTESYEARFNLILSGGTSHSFDMHGEVYNGKVCESPYAGRYIYIHDNTFMNEGHPAVVIRGRPFEQSLIENNTFIHGTVSDAIEQYCEGQCAQGVCNYADGTPCPGNSTCIAKCSGVVLSCSGNLTIQNNKYLSGVAGTGIMTDILILNTSGDLIKYSSDNQKYFAAFGEKVGNGFGSYTEFLPGEWLADGTSDLIARTSSGELHLYPFTNGTFYGNGGPMTVGHGFNYEEYFVGNWTGNGTSDLIARTSSGELHLYPFANGTFYGNGGPLTVGNGFNYEEYFVGNWTGDGTSDLIARTVSGELHLYPFRNGTFYGNGGPIIVGHGFSYQEYLVGNWTGDGTSDLIARSTSGELHFYPFRNGTFYGNGGPITVGTGFHYQVYLVGNWTGNGTSDLITNDQFGNYFLYPFNNGTFVGQNSPYNIGVEYAALKYLVGHW